jgi:GNAT superfamily N-acetyltransferase
MSNSSVKVRDADKEDISALADLMTELGYQTSVDQMHLRFNRIAAHSDYKTIVAVLNDEVVGMAGLAKGIYYEKNGSYLRIVALVVKSAHRGQGVGKFLLDAVEKWAIEQGLNTVLVNCGNREERKASHAFYEKMGYTVKSLGFIKQMAS